MHGNYAPYNLLPAITDTLIPLWLLGLLYAYCRCGGFEGVLRRPCAKGRKQAAD